MCVTGSLQSPYWVVPPQARTWNAYVTPAVRLVTRIFRGFVKMPANFHSPTAPPVATVAISRCHAAVLGIGSAVTSNCAAPPLSTAEIDALPNGLRTRVVDAA